MTYLSCPKCKQIWKYESYPSDPQLSLVECLHCGHVGVGASFPRQKKDKFCINCDEIIDQEILNSEKLKQQFCSEHCLVEYYESQ